MKTELLRKKDFSKITSLLKAGEIVAFPTDTVFGIGVIYNDGKAVEKMKEAKGRDASKPFPLMVSGIKQLDEIAWIGEREKKIAEVFMPGALTLVLRRKDTINKELVNGLDTIAIRIPDDYFVLRLLRKTGPMFVTSANLSGEPAGNTHEEVLQQLDGRIAAVVKGRAQLQVASTIIDCTGDQLKCLREGSLK
ncbi:MAG: threonylcarbamoyl-AMP synthase, partial [Erysipelotrichaceae bacterium]|nr:threonylcarbamoyl-AMP synthase [Erysipelotrichaceae bacterium]